MSTPVVGRVVGMDREQVIGLLREIVGADGRHRPPDADSAQAKAEVWHKILADVDQRFALRFVHRYYSDAPEYAIQPGMILNAWREQQTAARTAARVAGEPSQPSLPGTPEHPSVGRFLKAVLTAVHNGIDQSTVPRPAGWQPRLVNGQDPARLCPYPDLCACEHKVCRVGWLDDEVATDHPWGGSRQHRRVKRCPHCRDALLMAEETGIAKKPNRWRGGRR